VLTYKYNIHIYIHTHIIHAYIIHTYIQEYIQKQKGKTHHDDDDDDDSDDVDKEDEDNDYLNCQQERSGLVTFSRVFEGIFR